MYSIKNLADSFIENHASQTCSALKILNKLLLFYYLKYKEISIMQGPVFGYSRKQVPSQHRTL
jgi:hypothetical protein